MPESEDKPGAVPVENDLFEVHSFYLYLLESTFNEEIPVSGQIAIDNDALRRFVLLLDLAVTPQMIRSAFRIQEHRQAAASLLRFYAHKPHRRREDRDKVDVVATTLFRALFPDFGVDASCSDDPAVHDFANLLERIYTGIEMPTPPAEHIQLAKRFELLRQEASTLRTFDELIDGGIMDRVRTIKQTLGPSFLHPSVLSVVSAYNSAFRGVFDSLFARATAEMRAFAAEVDRDGAITKPVDERDVVEESAKATSSALRQISNVRRTIENDRRQHRSVPEILDAIKTFPQEAPPPPSEPALLHLSDTAEPEGSEANGYQNPTSTVAAAEAEAKELASVKTTIRSFVRLSESRSAQPVPLPDGNIQLTSAEVEAFLVEYGEEKSFRAEYASVIVDLAAIDARLRYRLAVFDETRQTPYSWKSHADALAYLLSEGKRAAERAMDLSAVARERGLHEKADALTESIEKIRPRGRAAVEALQAVGLVQP